MRASVCTSERARIRACIRPSVRPSVRALHPGYATADQVWACAHGQAHVHLYARMQACTHALACPNLEALTQAEAAERAPLAPQRLVSGVS